MIGPVNTGRSGGLLVTVYVVNRNYGRFLQQAVDSVLDQDYPFIEVLVIDDASDDEDSAAVLAGLEGRAEVRVIRQASNRGLTVCANTAIRQSSGEFVMRLDADDYLEPSAVSALVSAIAETPGAVLAFPDYFDVDTRGTVIRRVKRQDVNALEAMSDLPAHGACTLVRRAFLDEMGGYDEVVSCQDGLDLWLHVGPEHRVVSIGEPLFFYRQHGGNLTRDEGRLLRARAHLIAKHVARRGLARPRVIGIIPVRGQVADPGSVPLRLLGGRPLIDWTVDEALVCDGIDRVVVSSPDPEVLDYIGSRYASKVGLHHRGAARAGLNVDLAATRTDVLDAEAQQGRFYDAGMTLTVESPFRPALCMQQAIHVMQLFDADGVVGVRRDDEVFYLHDGLGLEPLRADERLRLERDDLYRETGGIRLVRLDSDVASKRMGHVLLDQMAAFAVRTELDWKTAGFYAEMARAVQGDGIGSRPRF